MAAREAVLSRQEELSRLRSLALNEGVPIVERARAVVERMHLVDDILSEQLRAIEAGEEA